ncbi:MAG: GWxTD domain-containing protein [Bacteroidota bacterium]
MDWSTINMIRMRVSLPSFWSKCLLLVAIFVCFLSPVKGQWNLDVKYIQLPKNNTRIYLGYQPQSELAKTYRLEIAVRPLKREANYIPVKIRVGARRAERKPLVLGTRQMVGDFNLDPTLFAPLILQKEVKISAYGPETFFIDISLPVNFQYALDVDITDIQTESHTLLQLEEPFFIPESNGLQSSDLLMSFEDSEAALLKRPVTETIINVDQEILHYGIYLYPSGNSMLKLKAFLLQEKAEDDPGVTKVYESIKQKNLAIPPQGKSKIFFKDTLDLTLLQAGTYSIWIMVESGSERTLEKLSFVRGGNIQNMIYKDLDQSIDMLKYVSSAERIAYLKAKDTAVVKKVEFFRTWEKLYGKSAQTEMENYFKKIYEANKRYQEGEKEGWETDRGKVFVLYGEPKEEKASIRGKDYLRWIFPKWSLAFLFEQEGESWVLRE